VVATFPCPAATFNVALPQLVTNFYKLVNELGRWDLNPHHRLQAVLDEEVINSLQSKSPVLQVRDQFAPLSPNLLPIWANWLRISDLN
jgi:hypothetical protein